MRVARLLPLLLVVALTGCPKTSKRDEKAAPPKAETASDAGHSDEAEHEELPKRVRLTKEVIADAKIRTAPAAREILPSTIALPGEIAADPDKVAKVSSLVPGRIADVRFKEGGAVKKGDVLAVVRVPEIAKVRSAYSATTAKAAAARANADRLAGLADKGLAAKQEALSAKAEAEALEAEARALNDQLGALGMGTSGGGSDIALRAPVSGIAIMRDAVVGQPVTVDQTIATIADLSEAWFIGRVFEKDLGQLKPGAKADVQLNAFPKEHFIGTVEYLGRQIDPTARTITARIRLTNEQDRLRIGLFGTARVTTGEAETTPTLVIPQTAVTEIGKKSLVFVRHADDDFELHEVVLGKSALGKVEVVNGLREGEVVVVDGVFTLKSAVLRGTLEDEH